MICAVFAIGVCDMCPVRNNQAPCRLPMLIMSTVSHVTMQSLYMLIPLDVKYGVPLGLGR